MGRVLAIARHELRLTLADRSAVVWLFLLPIAFAAFFGMVMGGGSGSPADAKADLAVYDGDGGELARRLVMSLQSAKIELTELEAAPAEVGYEPVRTLTIPEGFTESVLAGDEVALQLDLSDRADSGATLMVRARLLGAVLRVLGDVVAGELDETAASADAEDLVRVETRFAGEASVIPGGFAQAIPGNVVMFVLLIAMTYGAASLTAERASGCLRRLVTTPASHREIVLGKIAGRLLVAWVQIVVLVTVGVIGQRVFGIDIGDDPLGLLVVLLVYAVAVAPLGVLFGAVFADPDRAASVGVLVTLAMAALGGCWWPLEVVSRPMQLLSRAFPTGWAMHALHRIISFGGGLGDAAVPMLVLLGFGAVFAALSARLLRAV